MSEATTPENKPAESTPQNSETLPDWARKAISDANSEAANYRNKAKTAADEAKAEVTATFNEQLKALSDEKSAITVDRDNATSNYEKLVVALQAGVPGDTAVEFAALLQGNSAEEFKAHADKLKGMFGTTKQRAVDHTAGFTGDTKTTPSDDFAAIFKANLTQR
jgi:vacuolar-type H+-ATPase subunit H